MLRLLRCVYCELVDAELALWEVAVLWIEERSEEREVGGGGGIRRVTLARVEEEDADEVELRNVDDPGVDAGRWGGRTGGDCSAPPLEPADWVDAGR